MTRPCSGQSEREQRRSKGDPLRGKTAPGVPRAAGLRPNAARRARGRDERTAERTCSRRERSFAAAAGTGSPSRRSARPKRGRRVGEASRPGAEGKTVKGTRVRRASAPRDCAVRVRCDGRGRIRGENRPCVWREDTRSAVRVRRSRHDWSAPCPSATSTPPLWPIWALRPRDANADGLQSRLGSGSAARRGAGMTGALEQHGRYEQCKHNACASCAARRSRRETQRWALSSRTTRSRAVRATVTTVARSITFDDEAPARSRDRVTRGLLVLR